MKKLLFIAALALGTYLVSAQAPEKMSYQAVIRNATGQLVQNQNVAVKASILQNSGTGTVVFSELLLGTTNANGLMNLAIGSGTVLTGSFSSINWSTGNYYLKTETDPTGGSNYTIAGTSQLLSVPYAMYAKTSGSGGTSPWTTTGNNISNSNSGNVGIGATNPTERLEVTGKTKTTNLQVTNGAGAGKVLASDANGNANWTQMMRTDVLSIGPFSFVSLENNHRVNVVKAYFPTSVVDGVLSAPINIPTGAVVSKIIVYFQDNNYTKDYTLNFYRVIQSLNVFPETIASSTTSSGQTVIQTRELNIPAPITIDNSKYFYFVSMEGEFTTNYEGINGVQVFYSYPVNN